jgi:hypothetical protein
VTGSDAYAIFLNGSYGVGKTATLDHVGNLLAAPGRPFALMDGGWFHRSWPVADHDPDTTAIEAQNIAAVWGNYRAVGMPAHPWQGGTGHRRPQPNQPRAETHAST